MSLAQREVESELSLLFLEIISPLLLLSAEDEIVCLTHSVKLEEFDLNSQHSNRLILICDSVRHSSQSNG